MQRLRTYPSMGAMAQRRSAGVCQRFADRACVATVTGRLRAAGLTVRAPREKAMTGADGQELSDRWQEALVLMQRVRRLWQRIEQDDNLTETHP